MADTKAAESSLSRERDQASSPPNDGAENGREGKKKLVEDNGGAALSRDKDLKELGIGSNSDSSDGIDPLKRTQNDDTATVEDDEEEHDQDDEDEGLELRKTSTAKELWKFRFRPPTDDEPEDWWFASTAIPLLAATMGPLANVLSIAALVTYWRADFAEDSPGIEAVAIPYADPAWCFNLNVVSLVCGFVGNMFLLFNFTQRVRYIIALPVTILMWYAATAILIGITVHMHLHDPPTAGSATYSQGYWHAVIAAILYMLCSMMLMVNMLGYFLGHYQQHFELSDEQRNLILQTMMFFLWLAGGAGVFSRVSGLAYTDALYFCDVTILTVGFGDFTGANDAGRGLVFPYSVGGIIILGLMVASIHKFAIEISHDKIVKGHVEARRQHTIEMSVTSSFEAQQRSERDPELKLPKGHKSQISQPFNLRKRTVAFHDIEKAEGVPDEPNHRFSRHRKRKEKGAGNRLKRITSKRSRIVILKEEKDRFDAMRNIQQSTRQFKRYFALTLSVIAFGLLWCVGALVFWQLERHQQQMNYFEAIYFCYVSLLTIGYGDYAPKSNAGKPFFIVWSLIAVPTMTILISDMSDTVVASYKRGTFTLADWTIMTPKGFINGFAKRHPRLAGFFTSIKQKRDEKKRLDEGMEFGAEEKKKEEVAPIPTLEELAAVDDLDEHELARNLTAAIRRTADDLKTGDHRRYTYEEWVEYTKLIRFTNYEDDPYSHDNDFDPSRLDSGGGGSSSGGNGASSNDPSKPPNDSDSDAKESTQLAHNRTLSVSRPGAVAQSNAIVDWDWIGPNSPMMAEQSETEWILDRLCESLDRYMRRHTKIRSPPPEFSFDETRRRMSMSTSQDGRASQEGESGKRHSRSGSFGSPAWKGLTAWKRKQDGGLIDVGLDYGRSQSSLPLDDEDDDADKIQSIGRAGRRSTFAALSKGENRKGLTFLTPKEGRSRSREGGRSSSFSPG